VDVPEGAQLLEQLGRRVGAGGERAFPALTLISDLDDMPLQHS
jgi:hypothetical protein